MLDNETKRRIDTCRDILVGKVPDPKSQVEQISIALIYKFMDDMDREAVEMGGKPGFFTGEYKKYAWSKIFDPRLGGFDMLALYSESITRMSQNPGIPQLFRDIFKNAYLPYRDPETLKLFLKSINDFTYDHSERLGDAFEYLLSVLGSQGDAGQFRTPRHIIDFMVEVVKPQKHETILDPACGTAGFLISSYKHIIKANTKKMAGDLLKTEERKKLLTNFKGYDISPDMVRLSLVNLYLHGFVQPQVMEYDTLTSEDRWNEYADVILANPPFMSPKGGIKPHKRFSVQSNRSEVLFVDYIAEHLTPTGRAAVIVPEGIIFQSANAYKQLRKYLVDEGYLYAVVSLPAGVFNPYSGVKTSILLMDRTIAKKAESVLFIKVDNDGFDLGAQRRSHDKNDLPGALELLNQYVDSVRAGKAFDADALNGNAILVTKEKLAENGEYNLTGERYRIGKISSSTFDLLPLGQFMKEGVKTIDPRNFPDEYFELWSIPAYDSGQPEILTGNEIGSQKKIVVPNDILLSRIVPHIRRCWIIKNSFIERRQIASTEWIVFSSDEIIPEYLRQILISDFFHSKFMNTITGVGGSLSRANPSAVSEIQIPLPPIDIQHEIVAVVEGYQKIIYGARQVVDNWKPQIDIDPEWPVIKLGEVCEIVRGSSPRPAGDPKYFGGNIPRLMVADLTREGMYVTPQIDFLTDDGAKLSRPMFKGELVMAVSGQPGLCAILNVDCCIHDGFAGFHNLDVSKFNIIFLYYLLSHLRVAHNNQSVGAVFKNLKTDQLREFSISLPPLEVQQTIVDKIESECKAVDGCRELIKIYEDKIKQVIDKVWEG